MSVLKVITHFPMCGFLSIATTLGRGDSTLATPPNSLWTRLDPFNLPVSCLCPVSSPSNQLTPRWPFRSVFLTSARN